MSKPFSIGKTYFSPLTKLVGPKIAGSEAGRAAFGSNNFSMQQAGPSLTQAHAMVAATMNIAASLLGNGCELQQSANGDFVSQVMLATQIAGDNPMLAAGHLSKAGSVFAQNGEIDALLGAAVLQDFAARLAHLGGRATPIDYDQRAIDAWQSYLKTQPVDWRSRHIARKLAREVAQRAGIARDPYGFSEIDALAVDAIRVLSIDMITKAKSGHPGLPLGAAPMAHVLFSRFLKFDPEHPEWPNRDRFILSPGHGSAMLYATLHLYGYDLSMDDLKAFRQLGSRTPGHPEYGLTPGVEATTGVLGMGFATGVGMAMAERHNAARFNRDGFPVVDHTIYGIVSDGDLMEGVAAETAAMAGTFGLGNIVYLWDDNQITIEGHTNITRREDTPARFAAMGWHVQTVEDGNDLRSIAEAVDEARGVTDKPSLIAVRTQLGYASPLAGDPSAHGSPLSPEQVQATRASLDWKHSEPFDVPRGITEETRYLASPRIGARDEWMHLMDAYEGAHPELHARFQREGRGELPEGWDAALPVFEAGQSHATRRVSGVVLNTLAASVPTIVSGSADLGPSNKTTLEGGGSFGAENPLGRNVHYGVRELGMAAAKGGMALSGLRPVGGTFFTFADHQKPAIRMAAMMGLPVTYVLTHDSIGVGEDGPTHQPVEQLAALRSIPGLNVFRPADANETREAWRQAMLRNDGPTALILSRQGLPVLDVDPDRIAQGVARGGYVLYDAPHSGARSIAFIATGSEVSPALAAARRLTVDSGIRTRVVSMPSREVFERQPQSYRDEVLPPDVTGRVVVEAGSPYGWGAYAGSSGLVIGMNRFGASAPGSALAEKFGFTADAIYNRVFDFFYPDPK